MSYKFLLLFLYLFINYVSFSQDRNAVFKVGESYFIKNSTIIYDKPDLTGKALLNIAKDQLAKILKAENNGYYYIEYEKIKGYVISLAFGEIPSIDNINSYIKFHVENEINMWQKKGEFEKTADYLKRVNEENRKIKVKELTDQFYSLVKDEYRKKVNQSIFNLGLYDADNESFFIKTNDFGELVIKIPITKAQYFKSNFPYLIPRNIDFYLNNNHFYLAKLDFYDAKTKQVFTYDSQYPTSYSTSSFNYTFNPIEIEIGEKINIKQPNIGPEVEVMKTSEVDIDIPISSYKNQEYFAVIIGNEQYKNEITVDYAIKDAKVVKEYLNKTIGIPNNNIHYVENATYGQMMQEIKWLNDLPKAFGESIRIFFYYAGHGMPDIKNKSSYVLPVDGIASITETAIKTDYIFSELSENKTELTFILFDACFSGGARNGTLIEGRSVKVMPQEGLIKGNLVVFSASSEDEIANPHIEEQHGLFTYYFLKKLKQSKGDITLGELSDYIKTNVYQNSLISLKQTQTPNINISFEFNGDWKKVKIK